MIRHNSARKREPLEFGLSLHPSTVGWRVPWPGLAQLAANTGYEGAVVPRDQPLPIDPETAFPFFATAMQLPVEVRQDEAMFVSTFPKLRPACEFAAQMGCKVALLGIPPSSEQPKPEQARIYRERLKECCGVLDEFAIRLALECITPLHSRQSHPYEFIWRNAEMLAFGLSVSPNIGLILDSWHWHHAGSDPEWVLDIPADSILDVHLSDSPPGAPEDIRDSQRRLPGDGVIDLRLFLELLGTKAYSRPLAVEIFGGLQELTPDAAARVAFEACERTFTEIGHKVRSNLHRPREGRTAGT
jgi:sugar phosphate isomerase/epimerase